MSSTDNVLIERDGAIGWIRINYPERLNAFSGNMRERIQEGLERFEADAETRCIVITGVGRAFSTGGDVRVMGELLEREDRASFDALVRVGATIARLIHTMRTPVIASVNGPAAGAGACLALACDLRVASESASIGFTFLRVGLHPDWGGSFFLPHLCGPALAAELMFTGGMIGAERAERLGLFNRVVSAGELDAVTRGLAGQVASAPADLLAAAKRTLRASMTATLDEVLEMEIAAQHEAFASEDFREGITAFLEKRAPRFSR